ncbi:hypothetical protein [Bacteroides heparinolyticus]|uniref:hypothetical protein n=1 Tax=Prevotella heparinolytica TaxID=28113 RepID=UPI0035A0E992
MSRSVFRYVLCFLAVFYFMSCRESHEDFFELIRYPSGCDSIFDCSKCDSPWIPYPCLGLDKKTFEEVEQVYAKPNYISCDTLFYGYNKNGGMYELEVCEMLSEVPYAIVTFGCWVFSENKELWLYFVKYKNKNIVFYGFFLDPENLRE